MMYDGDECDYLYYVLVIRVFIALLPFRSMLMTMLIITLQITITTLIVMKLDLGLAVLSRLSCGFYHVWTMLMMTIHSTMTRVIMYTMFS